MLKTIVCLIACCAAFLSNGQNLIPDPGFEDYDTCPKGLNMGAGLYMQHWFCPTAATSDYYNVCGNSLGGVAGVPKNRHGYQQVPEGNFGYAGLHVIGSFTDYKEYVSSKLSAPLIIGQYYAVTINVSLADSFSNFATDNLGAYFHTDTFSSALKSTGQTLPFNAQIAFSNYGIITDSINWVTLVDTFQADSAYNYITIGGVVPTQFTNRIRVGPDSVLSVSYYYIDDVSVERVLLSDVDNTNFPRVTISPNPVSDKTTFNIPGYSGIPFSISLINMMGQKVWERVNVSETVTFQRESLPSGIYQYRIMRNGELLYTGKLMME